MIETLPAALAVLSAMITPAVLISACASLILATSARLGRVVDRTRNLSQRFEDLTRETADGEEVQEKRAMLFDQLDKATSRARLLQRAMTRLYLALSVFVGTSVAIGIVATSRTQYAWIPIGLGLVGGGLLLMASVLLIWESRLALAAVYSEMDFTWRLSQRQAPSDLVEQRNRRRKFFRRVRTS